MIYSVVLVSVVQQSESHTYIYIYIVTLFKILFPYRSLRGIEYKHSHLMESADSQFSRLQFVATFLSHLTLSKSFNISKYFSLPKKWTL